MLFQDCDVFINVWVLRETLELNKFIPVIMICILEDV